MAAYSCIQYTVESKTHKTMEPTSMLCSVLTAKNCQKQFNDIIKKLYAVESKTVLQDYGTHVNVMYEVQVLQLEAWFG